MNGTREVLERVRSSARRLVCACVTAALSLLAAGACVLVAGAWALIASSAEAYTAYVASSAANTVTPISTATNAAGRPIAVWGGPSYVALTPDGRTAYVSDNAAGAVTPINTATNTAGAPIPVGGAPSGIAVSPDGRTAYVANSGSGTVTPINTATNTAGAPIAVGGSPVALAVSPDGHMAYVVNSAQNTVVPVALATGSAGRPVPVGLGACAIAISPDGRNAYVVSSLSGTVTPISLSSDTAGAPIHVGPSPQAIAVSPDGTSAYVTDRVLGTVSQLTLPTGSIRGSSPIGLLPAGVAVSPDGAGAYVASSGSNLVAALSAAGASIPPIGVGASPLGIAISPDQAPLAAFTTAPRPAGTPSSFDASPSLVATSPIADYHWSFGDGSGADSASPVVSHTYASPGSYTVALTVADSAGTSTSDVFTGQTMSRNGSAGAQAAHTVVIPSRSAAAAGHPSQAAARAVALLPSSLVVTPRGYAYIEVMCPAYARGGCHGTISLHLAGVSRAGLSTAWRARVPAHASAVAVAARCARGCRALGSADYQARAGHRVRVRVRIASFGRRMLARHRALLVTVVAVRVTSKRRSTSVRTVTLRPSGRSA